MSQFARRPKVVELLKQSYKPLLSWVSEAKLPQGEQLGFLSAGSVVKHINMKAIGRCTVDGVEMEFADVRIYVMPAREDSELERTA